MISTNTAVRKSAFNRLDDKHRGCIIFQSKVRPKRKHGIKSEGCRNDAGSRRRLSDMIIKVHETCTIWETKDHEPLITCWGVLIRFFPSLVKFAPFYASIAPMVVTRNRSLWRANPLEIAGFEPAGEVSCQVKRCWGGCRCCKIVHRQRVTPHVLTVPQRHVNNWNPGPISILPSCGAKSWAHGQEGRAPCASSLAETAALSLHLTDHVTCNGPPKGFRPKETNFACRIMRC